MNKSIITVLRWVGVLPSAVISYFLIYAISKTIGLSSIDDSNDISAVFILPIVSSVLAVYAYITVGCILAPYYKFRTAIILAIPMACLLLFSLYLQVLRFHIPTFFELIGSFIGLIVAIIFSLKDERNRIDAIEYAKNEAMAEHVKLLKSKDFIDKYYRNDEAFK